MNKSMFLAGLILLQGCGSNGFTQYDYLKKQGLNKPTSETFPHCYRYGCDRVTHVSLREKEWNQIDLAFQEPAKTPENEREQIKDVIGKFEQIVGAKTGTEKDTYGTFRDSGPYQQDCIDESTNTTIYLSLLEQRGHLKYHKILPPESRIPLLHGGRWPHRTAQIIEVETNKRYAVDSWFHDNGFPAEVISMPLWKKGWKVEENFRRNSAY